MTLSTPWEIEQTWGSHQPVLDAVLEVLQPTTAIECGCGTFSTGVLRAHVRKLITLEHDVPWAKKMIKLFPITEHHSWILCPLPGVHNGTDPSTLKDSDIQHVANFYHTTFRNLPQYDFLFVDTYRCARVPAAQVLAPQADVLLLHDVRPSSRDFYRYHLLDGMLKDWIRYELRPEGFIAKSHILPWTALYSKEELPLDEMNVVAERESLRLWDKRVGLERI